VKVSVVPYDPGWVATFEAERRTLQRHLPKGVAIEHVGSTAVPGIPAKPIVDIAVAVPSQGSLDAACAALVASGRYIHFRFLERWRPERRYLVVLRDEAERAKWPATVDAADWSNEVPLELRLCQVHLLSSGSEMLKELLALRDLLIRDPAARETYAQAKLSLSKQVWPSSREYALRKDAVIAELGRKAGQG
jgi:GrpB-like predicted nucleotidyltransferase (UPF0157 family)